MAATRPYDNSKRRQSALETRHAIIESARQQLGESSIDERFSMEAVARRAGVSRVAIYQHFPTRRELLEATLDLIAQRGGLQQIDREAPSAIAEIDPLQAIEEVVRIFTSFWASDLTTLQRLHAMAGLDSEFAQGMTARNERRRVLLTRILAPRFASHGISEQDGKALIDILYSLTSLAMFSQLGSAGREASEIRQLVSGLCRSAWRDASRNPNGDDQGRSA